MERSSVTIIGIGPRGMSILERIVAFARTVPLPLQVNLVDPGECGPGVHLPRQPQHLLINTLASQVTIFPFAEAVQIPCACEAPSLTEWARAQGYRRFGEQFVKAGAAGGGEEITDDDYLPRQLLGLYLSWAYAQVAGAAPPSMTIRHLRQRAADMAPQPGGGYLVELENGFSLASDFVFLATGHCRNKLTDEEAWYRNFAQDHARYNSKLGFVRHVYPLDRLAGIAADATVAVQGLGLTAHDVVAELTVGRGGEFVTEDGELHHIRSGMEPQLILFSRNCMPALARGVNQKGLAGRHQARFFTRDAVAEMREQRLRAGLGGQLDFDRDLFPLVIKEMGYAWRTVADGVAPDAGWYAVGEDEKEAIDAMLFPLRGRSFGSAAEFRAFFRNCLEQDLCEAGRGNLGSPAKAAADVLRDARAVLQDVVENGGLAPASHRKFLNVYNPAINRITFGPPCQRNAQLLALMDAGVLSVAPGPNAALRIDEERSRFALYTKIGNGTVTAHADVLVVARLDTYSPESDDSVFTRNLVKRGIVRPYFNGGFHPGGLDIDYANHPVGRSGRASSTLWAVGCLVEGAHYYTHALPRPRIHSRQVLDADRCVRELFTQLAARHPAAPKKRAPRLASGLALQRC
ncbi:FAD/NAD(P)-binding protein [Massilia cavernae]|uniref:FAD-dependent urate hydroxylase HpyO/Asp monooxygenase CreE-like FAD/NAD(P)-binding domain-containing protein n=1 Tax=Massilia cavernae TaxID=2320864 RepID=A0A418XQN1_9BURK|nr:FAD/NAD(P)-binding domain-containing protein [Massilia cavernae]RJG14819.1 hypothetical protein D3872_16340 [Massilia cavernae]